MFRNCSAIALLFVLVHVGDVKAEAGGTWISPTNGAAVGLQSGLTCEYVIADDPANRFNTGSAYFDVLDEDLDVVADTDAYLNDDPNPNEYNFGGDMDEVFSYYGYYAVRFIAYRQDNRRYRDTVSVHCTNPPN